MALEAFETKLEQFRRTLLCPLCDELFKDCHTLPTCNHHFCYACVIDTLEGPGINKSVCPQCGQPCWKKDLVRNHTVNNSVYLVERVLADPKRDSSDIAARDAACEQLGQQLGAPLPVAASAGAHSGGDPAAAEPPSGRRRSAKPRRRGRSVPEEEQLVQQLPAGAPVPAAGAAAPAPQEEKTEPAAEAAVTAQEAAGSAAAVAGPDGAAPTTPEPADFDSDWEARMLAMSPHPAEELPQLEAEVELLRQAVLLCDQMLAARGDSAGASAAASGPAAARVHGLHHGQAGPCTSHQDAPPRQAQEQQAGAASAGAAAAEQQQQQAGPAAASSPQQDRKRQAAALQQAGAAGSEEGSPCMAGRKRRKGFSGRSRRVGKAASDGGATATVAPLSAQQQPPSACDAAGQPGLLAPVLTDGNNSSGEDDFKQPPAGVHRGSRAQQQRRQERLPAQRAQQGEQQPRPPRNYHEKRLAAKARQFQEAEAAFAPVRNERQAQQAQHQPQYQPQQHQQRQRQDESPPPLQHQQQQQTKNEPLHLRHGDAVEVMWKAPGGSCGSHGQVEQQLRVPYHGIVTAVRQHEGHWQHRVSYTDGEVQWTALAEEEWRRLSADEALAARLQLGMLEAGKHGSLPESSQEQRDQQLQHEEGCPSSGDERQQRQQGSPAPSLPALQAHGSPTITKGDHQLPDSSAAAADGPRAPSSRPGSAGRAAAAAAEDFAATGLCDPASARQAAGGAARAAEHPPAMAGAVQPPEEPAAVAAAAGAASGADPYLFVSNTELVPDSVLGAGLLPAAALRQQQQQQQQARVPLQVQAQAGRPPVAPPPKFPQSVQQRPKHSRHGAMQPQEPAWLQPRPAAAREAARPAPCGGAQQQQFSRKRKEPEGGGARLALATDATAPANVAPAAAAEAAEAGGSCSERPLRGAEVGAAGDEPALDTQDAAGALCTMLQARQPIAAVAGPRPLRPTSKHNAARAEDKATSVGAAVALASAATPNDFVAASQLLDGLPPMEAPWVGQHGRQPTLQDPGLFDSSQGGSPGGAAAARAAAGGEAGGGSEDPGQLRLPDLFKGTTPSQPIWLPDSEAAEGGAELATAEGEEGVGPDPGDRCAVSPVRVCIVISNTTAEIQQKVLRLQQLVPGVELQEQVTEHTTHVLVPADDRGIVQRRSVQYLLGLAHGCWVVSYQWVDACLTRGSWVAERNYQAQGSKEGMYAPARARQRHHGADARPGAGLFAGHRVHVIHDGSRPYAGAAAGPRGPASHHIQAMVAAEGGEVARSLSSASGPRSPSPEGGTLLLYNPTSRPGLPPRQLQKRYSGRTVVHAAWVYDSLCQSRRLDPSQYAITEAQPVPLAVLHASQAGSSARQLGGGSQLGSRSQHGPACAQSLS